MLVESDILLLLIGIFCPKTSGESNATTTIKNKNLDTFSQYGPKIQRPSHRYNKHSHRLSPKISLSSSFPVDYGGNHPYEVMARKRRDIEKQQTPDESQFNEQEDYKGEDQDRNLQYAENDEYKPIRFSFITDYLEKAKEEEPNKTEKIDFIEKELLPKASKMWSEALSVFPTNRIDLNSTQLDWACFDDLDIDYEGPTMFEDVDFVAFLLVDIDECFLNEEGESSGFGGFASPCQLDQYFRPVVGFVSICTSAIDLNDKLTTESFVITMQHEFVHMLGFHSALLKYFINPSTGLPRLDNINSATPELIQCANNNTSYDIMPSPDVLRKTEQEGRISYELVTPAVKSVVRNQFNCMEMNGARLENQPTNILDCFGSHWDQRLFHSEFMVPNFHDDVQFVTPLTLAYFEDSGWYKSNYSVTSLSPWGHAAGCSFVNEDCIVDGNVPAYSDGFFCSEDTFNGCSPTHRYVNSCGIYEYDDDIPKEFQYFPGEPKLGGFIPELDYCPVFEFPYLNGEVFHFDCTNPSIGADYGLPIEEFGPDSRCHRIDDSDFEYNGRSLCLRTICDEENHVVRFFIGNETYVCERDGQSLVVNNITNASGDPLKLKCPRLAQICPDLICPKNCAGRGTCDFEQTLNPKCKCNDPDDPSDFCANSPIITTETSEPNSPIFDPTQKVPAPTIRPTDNDSTSSGYRMKLGRSVFVFLVVSLLFLN